MALLVPTALAQNSTGDSDPIRYYTRPGIGRLFRRRIEMGLELIRPLQPPARVLEVGYGAGVVLHNLAATGAELYGIDLDADPGAVTERLQVLGTRATLSQGSVLAMQDTYADAFFDVVVCFSVMEHLVDPGAALAEMLRVLKPGGQAIIGMPAVTRWMEFGFRSIGFKNIDDYHVTTPLAVRNLIQADERSWHMKHRSLPAVIPFGLALYHVFALQKR